MLGCLQILFSVAMYGNGKNLGKWKNVHRFVGYTTLSLWFLVAEPTGIYLTLTDPNITGWFILKAAVVINFMDTCWESTRLFVQGLRKLYSPDGAKQHAQRMAAAFATAQWIIFPRMMIMMARVFGVFEMLSESVGPAMLYSLMSGLPVVLTMMIQWKLIQAGIRSLEWTVLRWVLWIMVPIYWEINK